MAACLWEAAVGVKADLLKAALDVVEKRGLVYGQAENNFARIAGLWSIYLTRRDKPAVGSGCNVDETDVAAMMSLMKIARLMEKPDHYDSWLDLAGYAACGAEVSGAKDPKQDALEPVKPELRFKFPPAIKP